MDRFTQTEIHYAYPAIDTTLAELNRRFSTDSIAVLKVVAAFIPGTDQFLNSDALLCLARQYEINIDDLSVKLQQIRRMIQRKEAEGNTSYSHIQPLSWSTMTVRPTTRSADFCVLHANCMQ